MDDAVGRINDDSPSDADVLRVRDVVTGSDCSDDMDGAGDGWIVSAVSADACMMSATVASQLSSSVVTGVLLTGPEDRFVLPVVVLPVVLLSLITLLAGVEGVCCREIDEAVSRRVEARSAVFAALRVAASDDGTGFRNGCEPGLVGLGGSAFSGLFSVVLDVDEVLTRLVDVVVLLDV